MAELEIKGMEEFQRKTEQIAKDLRGPPMLATMRDATLLVQRDARMNAPVDTGRLRASIVPEVVQHVEMVQGIIGSNVEYAPYQEFGTKRGLKGRRYLQRALEANVEKIKKIFDLALRRIFGE
jgi:HK97 gp10 family phage protein